MKLINLLLLLLLSVLISCDGIFPDEDKTTVPADHTDDKDGVLHKSGANYPFGTDTKTGEMNCGGIRCHNSELTGGLARVDNLWSVAPSCYQCHGKLWKEIDSLETFGK